MASPERPVSPALETPLENEGNSQDRDPAHARLQSHSPKARPSGSSRDPQVPLWSRTPPQISRPRASRFPANFPIPQATRISHVPRVSCAPGNLTPLQLSRPLGSLEPPQISRPSGLAFPRKSRGPSRALGSRTPDTPRPRAPRGARQRWGPRKPRGRRAPPPAPDSLLTGLTVGGHSRALAGFGVHNAPSRRRRWVPTPVRRRG